MRDMDRRQFIAGSLLLAPAALGITGCSIITGAGGEGVFRHGFDKDFPPYSYIDDMGQTTGFDVELAMALCDHYGWAYEPVPINWDAKDAELNAGSIDCIWSGFTKSPIREDDYCWSEPYSINAQVIMVKEDSGLMTLADLAGKKVGVQSATAAYDMLKTPKAEGGAKEIADSFRSVEVYDTYTIAITDLQAGAIAAVAIDETSGLYQLEEQDGLRFLEEELGDEVFAIGFRKDDTERCEQVNKGLRELADDGTMEEIGRKYDEIFANLTMIKK